MSIARRSIQRLPGRREAPGAPRARMMLQRGALGGDRVRHSTTATERRAIVRAAAEAAYAKRGKVRRRGAVQETGMGVVEHKRLQERGLLARPRTSATAARTSSARGSMPERKLVEVPQARPA